MRNHKKDTNESFIQKAKKAHGDKYDYSLVDYKASQKKVKIICPDHGEFEQLPNHHIKGSGCWKCAGTNPIDTEEFIEKAKKIHKNKYDYSKVRYTNTYGEVEIICPKHGEFIQIANTHLTNHGCPRCAIETRASIATLTTEEFIQKSIKIHGNKYNYSKVNYKNSSTKVEIICPEHGNFWQQPNAHSRGQGCPNCKTYVGCYNTTTAKRHKNNWLNIESSLYLIEGVLGKNSFIKIGVTTELKSRLEQLRSKSGIKIIDKIIIKTNLYEAVMTEQLILKNLKKHKYKPETYFPGHTECININQKENILSYIKTNINN